MPEWGAWVNKSPMKSLMTIKHSQKSARNVVKSKAPYQENLLKNFTLSSFVVRF